MQFTNDIMRQCRAAAVVVLIGCILPARVAAGAELRTQYTTITYENENLLRDFNHAISLGSLSYLLLGRKSLTSDDEIRNKVDVLVDRIQTVLDMRPKELKFRIALLATSSDVRKTYRAKYGSNADFIAFYSKGDKTVYVSVDDIRLGVLSHELAHVVIDHYFGVAPPVKIHEVLAQFVEEHLKD
ncbi:MAG: hypothetical protein M0024_08575 [Nitrospiraceae bacterium]|nr:hypothetical protein [Nitrospiraceae bacterium]